MANKYHSIRYSLRFKLYSIIWHHDMVTLYVCTFFWIFLFSIPNSFVYSELLFGNNKIKKNVITFYSNLYYAELGIGTYIYLEGPILFGWEIEWDVVCVYYVHSKSSPYILNFIWLNNAIKSNSQREWGGISQTLDVHTYPQMKYTFNWI